MFLKDKKVAQPGKNLILGKKPEISLKIGSSGVNKISQVINKNALCQPDSKILKILISQKLFEV